MTLGSSQLQLLKEAKALHEKSRAWLAESPPAETNETPTKGTPVTDSSSQAQMAGQLYAQGKPVVEVAKELGITYGKARKLIDASGTTIRDGSSRLKGRTRPVK
jgi:hypothetical protein